jgi:hypothetical protein
VDQLRRSIDVAAAIAVVAAITMLVRPGSNGPLFVTALGQAFVNAVAGAVGASITPDAQIPGADRRSGDEPSGPARGPTTGGYRPELYDIPAGDQRGSYFA